MHSCKPAVLTSPDNVSSYAAVARFRKQASSISDFLNDDAQLLQFLNQIKRPDGTLPYFELLIEAHNMGANAVRSHIVAWRTKK